MDPAPSYELVLQLQQFAQASDRYVESTASAHSSHRTDMNALGVIMRYQRAGSLPSPRDLSRELQLSAPATTAMLDRLERLGYIERRRTDADRRVIRIAMTELAQSSGQEMFAPLARKLHQVIQGYPSDQVELITQFLREATAGVDEVREATASQIPTRKRA